MENSPDRVVDTIKEIQSSNRFILKRLNQVFLSSDCKTFDCECKDDMGKFEYGIKHAEKNDSSKTQAVGGAEGNINDVNGLTEIKFGDREFTRESNERNKKLRSSESSRWQLGIEVIEQTEVKCHDDEEFWRFLTQKEVDEGRETLRDLEGVHSIICLDISASMSRGSAWTEAKTFVMDYLSGLEEVSTRYDLSDEYVALVTFGHETKVQMRLTDKFIDLRDATDCLRLGGPSPLYGGMTLALGAAGSTDQHLHVINYTLVFPKVIIITDGHLTDQRMFAGPDNPAQDPEKAKAKILESAEEYKSNHIDMFIVPVGPADMEFLGLMSAVGTGTMLDYHGGRQLSRRTYLTSKIQDPLGLMPSLDHDSRWSKEDKETMDNIQSKAQSVRGFKVRKVRPDMYNEINHKDFPAVGSRVRRGPDWPYWDQDSHGPGTVIGHNENLTVWVEWDANKYRNYYRYGGTGYDVLLVDEPRVLDRGQEIAVGCVVKPGKDLRSFRPKDKGVVIKLDKTEKKATIRWFNGKRTDCSYGQPGRQDIVICSEFQPHESDVKVHGSKVASSVVQPIEKQLKSRNKNFSKLE